MFQRLSRGLGRLMVCAAMLLPIGKALAVQPGHWSNTTEADFDSGTMHDTVVTNLGEVKLANKTHLVAKLPQQGTILYDMQSVGGKLYLAAGPTGMLLRRDGKKVTTIATLKGEQIFSLGVYRGKLLVAISGTPSRLAVLVNGKLQTLAKLKGVRYIWDTLVQGKTIIVATGTKGKILAVNPSESKAATQPAGTQSVFTRPAATEPKENATVTTVLDTRQANVLCLGQDGRGRIYAGTDTNGLVYRITKQKAGGYRSYVLYDAPEPEIGALLVMKDGTVYAGTANARQARPGRLKHAASKEAGRPVPEKKKPEAPSKPPHTPPGPKPLVPKGGVGHSAKATAKPDARAKADKAQPGKQTPHAEAHIKAAGSSQAAAYVTMPGIIAQTTATKPAAARPKPTPAQYDRLRQVVEQRLKQAQQSGSMPSGPPATMQARSASTGPSRVEPVAEHQPRKEGNAIYRIDPQGFVREVFRESVMILKIIKVGDHLIVGTGNQGELYSVDPAKQETTILSKLKPEQIPAITIDHDGNILLGTANPGRLLELDRNVAHRGTYTSTAMDASQISLWGKLNITATIPAKTSLTVETRSGNVSDPNQGGWSIWSRAQVFVYLPEASPLRPRQMTIQSPPARFLQYRLTLLGHDNTSPTVNSVDMAYITPNLRPDVTTLSAAYPQQSNANGAEPPTPTTTMRVRWKAHDPNHDHLRYTLEYRRAGSKTWIQIKKNLNRARFAWQTRQVPDGYYVLRVTASDSPDNPPGMAMTDTRQSDPVLVDNQPPRLTKLTHSVAGTTLTLKGLAVDDYSSIQSVDYVIDSGKDYQVILPNDLIFDSTREAWHVKIPDLSPGAHMLTLRVMDARGNATYRSVAFEVK